MKRKVFWFAAILLLGCLTACDDDRDDKVYYRPLIVTVHTLDDGDYYFERDNGQTLYPSDKSLVPGYEAKERQRAVITFDLLGGGTGYDYDIALSPSASFSPGPPRSWRPLRCSRRWARLRRACCLRGAI